MFLPWFVVPKVKCGFWAVRFVLSKGTARGGARAAQKTNSSKWRVKTYMYSLQLETKFDESCCAGEITCKILLVVAHFSATNRITSCMKLPWEISATNHITSCMKLPWENRAGKERQQQGGTGWAKNKQPTTWSKLRRIALWRNYL